ncbi:MAG: hypothetical protein ACYC4L_17995 [Chloroflexota bacterium]
MTTQQDEQTRRAQEPIELFVYVPDPEQPGYSKLSHTKTIGEVLGILNARIRASDFPVDEYGFDPWQCNANILNERWPEQYAWVACYAVTGGSEGHYIHVDLLHVGKEGETSLRHVFLAKTFLGWDYACGIASTAGRLLRA